MNKTQPSYQWVIAILCFFTFFLVIGLGNIPHNLYIVPVTNAFNFSRGQFSLVFSIITLIGLIIQLLFGLIVKRLGIRLVVSIGLCLVTLGYLIFSRATTLAMFFGGAVLMGFGFACSTLTSISILINNWFTPDQQGTMLGIIAAGSGFGGSLFSLIIGNVIVSQGFQASYFLTAIILGLGAIPIILLLRSKPAQDIPCGDEGPPCFTDTDNQPPQGETAKDFLTQPHIYLAIITVLIIGISVGPSIINTPVFLIEKGFDTVFAASIISALFIVQAFTKIGIGFFNDRVGIRTSLYIGLGAFVIALVLLILTRSVWMTWVYVFFGGVGLSVIAVLVPLFAREVLGKSHYERYIGVFVATLTTGLGIGNPVINFAYDLTGTYTFIYILMLFMGVGAIFLTKLSLKLKAKNVHYTASPSRAELGDSLN